MTEWCNFFLVVRQAVCTPPDPTGRNSGVDATRAKGKTFSGDNVQFGQGQSMYFACISTVNIMKMLQFKDFCMPFAHNF